jgi:hypothetical protein
VDNKVKIARNPRGNFTKREKPRIPEWPEEVLRNALKEDDADEVD